MLVFLHRQATTTPKIQASDEPAWSLADRYGISEQTVWKYRRRDGVQDLPHTPHRLQTTLMPAEEAVAVALRMTLLLPLDDPLAVVREFLNANVSLRSGPLPAPSWRVPAAGPEAEGAEAAHNLFKACEPGYLHIDVKYLPQIADDRRRRYLFVAIDRANRWVSVRIYPTKTGPMRAACLARSRPGGANEGHRVPTDRAIVRH